MMSPTMKGLENCNASPLRMVPSISLAAKAVATPALTTRAFLLRLESQELKF